MKHKNFCRLWRLDDGNWIPIWGRIYNPCFPSLSVFLRLQTWLTRSFVFTRTSARKKSNSGDIATENATTMVGLWGAWFWFGLLSLNFEGKGCVFGPNDKGFSAFAAKSSKTQFEMENSKWLLTVGPSWKLKTKTMSPFVCSQSQRGVTKTPWCSCHRLAINWITSGVRWTQNLRLVTKETNSIFFNWESEIIW